MIRLPATPLGAALTALGLLALGAKREREARETAESVYAPLADEDSTNVDSAACCELMSRQARRQTVRDVRRSASGDRATASVRFGKAVNSVPLVREGGEWRLASNPAADS